MSLALSRGTRSSCPGFLVSSVCRRRTFRAFVWVVSLVPRATSAQPLRLAPDMETSAIIANIGAHRPGLASFHAFHDLDRVQAAHIPDFPGARAEPRFMLGNAHSPSSRGCLVA